jgi:hypothetical protein
MSSSGPPIVPAVTVGVRAGGADRQPVDDHVGAGIGIQVPERTVVGVGLAVERARPGDGDVPLPVAVDERRVVHQLDALPAGEDDRQVVGWVLAEQDRGVLLHVQVHVAAQVDRAGEERAARRDDDVAAARAVAGGDRFREGLGIEGGAVALRPEGGDREVPVGNRGRRTEATMRSAAMSAATPAADRRSMVRRSISCDIVVRAPDPAPGVDRSWQ